MDVFTDKNLEPMLFHESEVFDSQDYIYELKFDGIRCLAYLDDQTNLRNKRNKDVSSIYPELQEIHKQINKTCVLDGEIIVMNNGKPDFFEVQRRSLLTNNLKINLLSTRLPVTFIAFDILYYDDQLLTDLPLITRKEILFNNITENPRLVISRHVEEKGHDFYKLAQQQDLEGIVAKEKTGKYHLGKRSRVWLKMKVYHEDDLIICGYVPKETGIKDLILGAYDHNNNLYHAATINTTKNKDLILRFAKKNPSPPLFPAKSNDIIWMKPLLVGKVQYMMKTKGGGLRQAVFLGVRDDKVATNLLH